MSKSEPSHKAIRITRRVVSSDPRRSNRNSEVVIAPDEVVSHTPAAVTNSEEPLINANVPALDEPAPAERRVRRTTHGVRLTIREIFGQLERVQVD